MVSVCARVSKIGGGFILVRADQLVAVWHACRVRPRNVGDFRVWLALREMVERRCRPGPGRTPAYAVDEAAKLCGITARRARASVKRLVAGGLAEWSDGAIGFPDHFVGLNKMVLEDTLGRGGSVAIPRRMLRLLAGGARPALIATALGMILRCLSRRRGGFDGRGRCKASWVAKTFGVDARRVQAARAELVSMGWIEPEPSNQRIENRHGRAFRIDLGWSRVRGAPLPYPPADEGRAVAGPSVDREPLREFKDQEPAGRGPAGLQGQGIELEGQPQPKAPTLDDVKAFDLRDAGRILELHRQAIERRLVTTSEADRLRVLAIAEHAAAIGTRNPAGLFVRLLKGKLWHFATADDEDAARRRLRAHLWPAGPTPVPVPKSPASTLSDDARVVREVSRALAAAGYRGDPFPQMRRIDAGWTRERWDKASKKLAEAHADTIA